MDLYEVVAGAAEVGMELETFIIPAKMSKFGLAIEIPGTDWKLFVRREKPTESRSGRLVFTDEKGEEILPAINQDPKSLATFAHWICVLLYDIGNHPHRKE